MTWPPSARSACRPPRRSTTSGNGGQPPLPSSQCARSFDGGAIPPAAPISQLSDIELGWLFAASLFAWIKCRAEQATAEGWDVEETLRRTSLDPQPWDAGAVEQILPQLGALPDFDWNKPIGAWSKDMMVRFLLEAMKLIDKAMIARDVGGSITTTRRQSLDEMQRTASAEAGGPLMTPSESNNPIGI